ncbi:MAG: ribosomal protein L7/L12 [Candidatus Sumerlaeaceae bacterium]|nr:ribosomal protein L7/L12 [Candidatus Sumerlaeaceae bacterium]
MEIPEDKQSQIEAELSRGNKIEAIKIHREATGLGLKESKDAIDALEAKLRAAHPDRFPVKSGCMSVVVLLLLITILLVGPSFP